MSARDAHLLEPDLMHADLHADEAAPPVAPSDALRAAVLRSASARDALAGFTRRVAALFDLPESRVAELLGAAQRPDAAPWQPAQLSPAHVAEGVRLLHFSGGARVAEADCGLVHIAPGVRFVEHTHSGDEWAFVLAGAAEEEGSGAVWLPGDLVHREAGTRHAFRVTSAEPFVFAVVLEGPIRPHEEPSDPRR
jgi:quercetin dioxygenase-like cupin family protein